MVRPTDISENELTDLRARVAAFIERPAFINTIIALIILNAIALGMETSASVHARIGGALELFDRIALIIFAGEIALKLFAYRLSFFRQGWNVFDFIIVGISLIPASGPLAVMRTLRVLRVLRLISVVPSMRRVIAALMHAIPGMASIIAVLLIIFYVASVLATKLFGQDFELLFGTIGASMFTLFQIMTLEGWSGEVVRPVMEVYPRAWIFFIPFIITTSFAVLNLFIGIIVDAMNIIHDKGDYDGAERRKKPSELTEEVRNMRNEIAELKDLLKQKP